MTVDEVKHVLLSAGYRDFTMEEAGLFHVVITIKSGRLFRPNEKVRREFYMRLVVFVRLEIRRTIRLFDKTITLWTIPNIIAREYWPRNERKKMVKNRKRSMK